MVGIEETGMLNEETLSWMDRPRCGMPDRVPEGAASDLPDGAVIAQAYTVPGRDHLKITSLLMDPLLLQNDPF